MVCPSLASSGCILVLQATAAGATLINPLSFWLHCPSGCTTAILGPSQDKLTACSSSTQLTACMVHPVDLHTFCRAAYHTLSTAA